jgi:hypothetical protein
MSKDPTRNVDSYKIRGGSINEFEYDKNQQALADPKAKGAQKLSPGTPPEEIASRKTTKKAPVAVRGASAKKLAARKAAQKK